LFRRKRATVGKFSDRIARVRHAVSSGWVDDFEVKCGAEKTRALRVRLGANS
jgi:hypothetical protein